MLPNQLYSKSVEDLTIYKLKTGGFEFVFDRMFLCYIDAMVKQEILCARVFDDYKKEKEEGNTLVLWLSSFVDEPIMFEKKRIPQAPYGSTLLWVYGSDADFVRDVLIETVPLPIMD